MASISKDANGNICVQFVGVDKRRRTIRLGKVNQKTAEAVKLKVEHLNNADVTKSPLDPDTARWVASIADDLAAKLAAVGLIPERPKAVTLGELVQRYDAETGKGLKVGTVISRRVMVSDLLAYFTSDADPRTISEDDAKLFVDHLIEERELASMTIARRLRRVRSVFAFGVKRKLLTDNPFAEVSVVGVLPAERKAYVPATDADKLISAANPTWRIIVALCRFAGLRCPSEVLTLKWSDVNFETNRMTVTSPKTERIPGKEYRVMPIFTALRPHLDEAFELAEPGEVYVVGGRQGEGYRAASYGPNGWMNTNLRTTFEKLIRRAGLNTWPRLFHTLRASCETDLLEHLPISAVTEWLGHSATIALKHYTRVPDHLFERAARGAAYSGAVALQKAVQSEADTNDAERTESPGSPEIQGFRRILSAGGGYCPDVQLTPGGLEPPISCL